MYVEIISSANLCNETLVKDKNAIVIDVLRATSVIVTALKNGATGVKVFPIIEDALEYAKGKENVILGGERHNIRIDKFDLGNSPLEYSKSVVNNKEIVLTTTNGARAIYNATSAKNLYILSFLNLNSVVKKLLQDNEDIVFVCSGTHDEFSLDDSLCAGLCIKYLSNLNSNLHLSDLAICLKEYANVFQNDLHSALKTSLHYNYLQNLGMDEDLDFCLSINTTKILPFYNNGKIICAQ